MLFKMVSPSWFDDTITNYQSILTAGSGNINTKTVANSGNYYVVNPIITLTAGSTNITEAIIQKMSSTGATILNELYFTGTLLAGNALVIDCGALTVLNNGVDASADFDTGTSHKEAPWFTLWPSNNTVRVTLTGGSTDSVLDVDFYPAHA